ncbi:MAG: Nif3-like dinuclear metal center hexameric protein [Promethearchaeota archaeon]
MYLSQIIDSIEELSPAHLNFYDREHGLIFGRKTDISNITIKRCLVTVEPSIECIGKAVECKSNLLISQNPLFTKGFSRIKDATFEKFRLLTKHNLWVYVVGDSWLSADEGISTSVCQSLNFNPVEKFFLPNPVGVQVPVGRIYTSKETMGVEEIIANVKQGFNIQRLLFGGEKDRKIQKILVFSGYFDNIEWLNYVIKNNVDMLLVGALSNDVKNMCSDLSLNFIEISLYETGILGMGKLRFLLSLRHPNVEFKLCDIPNFKFY